MIDETEDAKIRHLYRRCRLLSVDDLAQKCGYQCSNHLLGFLNKDSDGDGQS